MRTIRIPRSDPSLIAALEAAGAQAVEILDDLSLVALFPDEGALPPLGEVDVRPAIFADQGSTWVDGLGPITIGELCLVPTGRRAPESAGQILWLAPAAGFGTGAHPTTALCLEQLSYRATELDVLDVGAGSGVLALAALLLGARSAVAIDDDPAALALTLQNARENKLEDRLDLTARLEEIEGERFALCLANIVDSTLMELAPGLVRSLGAGGTLVLSGVRSSEEAEVRACFERLGLAFLEATRSGPWVCQVFGASW